MTELVWDERRYEVGLDRGVFYPMNGVGEAWNGLISVSEQPTTLAESVRYIDGIKVVSRMREDSFSAKVDAFTYPLSFPDHDLTTQRRTPFGFSYREQTATSYQIHLVYNAVAKLSQNAHVYSEVAPFSYDITTKPVPIPGMGVSAHLIIDADKAFSEVLVAFEAVLYGSETTDPRLPMPDEIWDIFQEHAALKVVDHGDGSFTVTGPDSAIQVYDDGTFTITWPSAIYIDSESYTIHDY